MLLMVYKISNIIHQIWFQGKDNINKEPYKSCYNNCRVKFKKWGWEHIIWDEKSIDKLFKKYPKYQKIYNSLPMTIQKIDVAKYMIMYHYGGVYVDMDMDCIKNIRELINPDDEIIVSNMDTNVIYSNGIFFSSPKNNFWTDMMLSISNLDKYWKDYFPTLYIQITVGNVFFTNFVKNYKGKKRILDYIYLEPCHNKFECNMTKEAYMIDKLANHWMSSYTQYLIKIYSKRKIIISIILVVSIILFYRNISNTNQLDY